MKMKSTINILLYLLGMSFNLLLMFAVGYAVFFATTRGFEFGEYVADGMVATGENYEFIFVLEEDTPAAEVARRLEEKGIINNQLLFRLELFLKNSTRIYRAGTYTLNSNMTNTDVNATLRRPPPLEVQHYTITIREGWTIEDMANYFESRGFFTAEEFIYATQTSTFAISFLNHVPDLPGRTRLEGFLFPDTYFIPINPSPQDIIRRMLLRFDEIFEDTFWVRAEELGMTMDQIVTMASIIETETRVPSERPLVSQVIHNRIRINMPLQMCSTVQYALPERQEHLLNVHLQIDSPYNTYMH